MAISICPLRAIRLMGLLQVPPVNDGPAILKSLAGRVLGVHAISDLDLNDKDLQ